MSETISIPEPLEELMNRMVGPLFEAFDDKLGPYEVLDVVTKIITEFFDEEMKANKLKMVPDEETISALAKLFIMSFTEMVANEFPPAANDDGRDGNK